MLNKIHSSRDIYFILFYFGCGSVHTSEIRKTSGFAASHSAPIAPSTLSAPYSTASADTVADSV